MRRHGKMHENGTANINLCNKNAVDHELIKSYEKEVGHRSKANKNLSLTSRLSFKGQQTAILVSNPQ